MRPKVPPIDVVAERWGAGMIRHGVETAFGAVSLARLRTVLWVVAPRLRIINYRAKGTACVTLPRFLLRHLGAGHGDYLEFIPRRGGYLVVRKASERQIKNAFRRYEELGRMWGYGRHPRQGAG